MSHSVELQKVKEMFQCETDTCRRNVDSLMKDAQKQMGIQWVLQALQQWKILAKKLNNRSKLVCLGDSHHRLMLLEFVKAEAVTQYRSSYFNRAKIHPEYITHLKNIGPYLFGEVITIVNKLKLIQKHHHLQNRRNKNPEGLQEDHIKSKIEEILAMADSRKRSNNSNLIKFGKIVQFQDREELVKELGKMLRVSWTKQKERLQPLTAEDQDQETSEHDKEDVREKQLQLIGSYLQNEEVDLSHQLLQDWI